MLLWRGGRKLSFALFNPVATSAARTRGRVRNAIVGTLVMVALAAMISVPIGVLSAIFLAQPTRRVAWLTRSGSLPKCSRVSRHSGPGSLHTALWFCLRVASQHLLGEQLFRSNVSNSVTTADDAIRMVPARMREAAIGMEPPIRRQLMVLLPTALPGILTGVMLPWPAPLGNGPAAPDCPFRATTGSPCVPRRPDATDGVVSRVDLQLCSMPFENQVELAWAAALILVLLVLVTNLAGQSRPANKSVSRSVERCQCDQYE